MYGDGVVYSALPHKGMAEFEVEIVSYGTEWKSPMGFVVMRCKKGIPIESGLNIPDVVGYDSVCGIRISC